VFFAGRIEATTNQNNFAYPVVSTACAQPQEYVFEEALAAQAQLGWDGRWRTCTRAQRVVGGE